MEEKWKFDGKSAVIGGLATGAGIGLFALGKRIYTRWKAGKQAEKAATATEKEEKKGGKKDEK